MSNSPSDSDIKVIQTCVLRHSRTPLPPLSAFDAAKRDLRSVVDIDWSLVAFDQETLKVTRRLDSGWAGKTYFSPLTFQ